MSARRRKADSSISRMTFEFDDPVRSRRAGLRTRGRRVTPKTAAASNKGCSVRVGFPRPDGAESAKILHRWASVIVENIDFVHH